MLVPGLIVLASACGGASMVGAVSVRCESAKDTGFGLDFSSYPQECASNRGGSSSVQVKTYQEAFAASFDLSNLRGRHVVSAELHVHMSQGALRVADVCTIAAQGWPEGTGTGSSPAAVGESSYDWMRAPGSDAPTTANYWGGYAGSRLADVTFGNGGSLCSYAHHTNISRDEAGWTTIQIPAILVEAMVADQDGLVLCDSSQLHNNTAVNTRSQGNGKPYLQVEVEESSPVQVAPQLSNLSGTVVDQWNGAAVLEWAQPPPRTTLGFDVRWSADVDGFSAGTFDSLTSAKTLPVAQVPRPAGAGRSSVCDVALDTACAHSTSQVSCLICAGQGQHTLKVAGCTDDAVRRYCALEDAVNAAGPVRLYLQDLPPGHAVKIGIRPYCSNPTLRHATPPSFITLTLPNVRPSETLAPMPPLAVLTTGPFPSIPGVLRIYGTEEYTKVSPVTGNRIGAGYNDSNHKDDSWKVGNSVFGVDPSVATQTAGLVMRAAKGEVVQAQLYVESLVPSPESLSVTSVSFIEQPGDVWSAQGLGPPQLSRLWYAPASKGGGPVYSSAILNFGDAGRDFAANGFSIPSVDNHINGQTNQGVWVSIFVPLSVPAGSYSGQVRFSTAATSGSGAAAVSVPLLLTVVDISLPERFTFALDLNSYSDSIAENCGSSVSAPDCELLTHQMAHAHRHTCNTLPYGQTGTVDNPYGPEVTGTGASATVRSWDAFDARLGKFLDGSAFTAQHGYNTSLYPGAGVPLTDFYLPFHEDYPAAVGTSKSLRAVYQPPGMFDLFSSNRTAFTEGFRLMGGLEGGDAVDTAAVPASYAEAFVAVVAQFKAHSQQMRWNRTQFQLYLNNKPSFQPNTGVWNLDEPVDFLDFVGNAYYHDLFRIGVGLPPSAPFAHINPPVRGSSAPDLDPSGGQHFDTRMDISTRFGQHKGALNAGRVSLQDVNGVVYKTSGALLARRKRELNTTLWWYGADGSEGASENGRMEGIGGMLLAQWSRGCDGGLPWWESDGPAGKDVLGPLAVVVKGTQWPGYVGPPLPSPRLKVALAGQQLVELLNILASKQGWSRHAVARAVCNYVTEVLPPQPHPCALAVGGFEGLDLNNLEYSDLTSKQLGELRLRVLATVLQ